MACTSCGGKKTAQKTQVVKKEGVKQVQQTTKQLTPKTITFKKI